MCACVLVLPLKASVFFLVRFLSIIFTLAWNKFIEVTYLCVVARLGFKPIGHSNTQKIYVFLRKQCRIVFLEKCQVASKQATCHYCWIKINTLPFFILPHFFFQYLEHQFKPESQVVRSERAPNVTHTFHFQAGEIRVFKEESPI
jgi:hypothetical protein